MNTPLNVNVCKVIVITFPYGFNNITNKQNSWLVQLFKNLCYFLKTTENTCSAYYREEKLVYWTRDYMGDHIM